MTSSFRTERDSMGELKVPAEALWGAQTQRAVQNFPISGVSMPREFIAALALVKQAAARANRDLNLLDRRANVKAQVGRNLFIAASSAVEFVAGVSDQHH